MTFGRLERTPTHEPMSDINMTPLVDVMLVLVVILLITAPLLAHTLAVDLPRSTSATPPHAAAFVTLTLDTTGQAYVDQQAVDANALTRLLQDAAQHDPDTEIRLRADARVPYGRVVEVMGLAHQAGLHRIGFATDPAATGSAPPKINP